ncbi:hypothetical protein HMPREF1567_1120 [Providencia alcalifaciens PAL-2]|nr:hypothetical protein HMPREF1562_1152 [Providencia alcalifaciens F90-2004]EUC94672.1 hypothetical protein HMPREF1567_1120 [Providencia alcalifaciens PAL-2]
MPVLIALISKISLAQVIDEKIVMLIKIDLLLKIQSLIKTFFPIS